MQITAVTKFKHGILFNALKQLKWSQSDLARETGIHPSAIGLICNLKTRPTISQANKIQNTLGVNGIYIDVTEAWPETFIGFKTKIVIEQTQEIDILKLQAESEFSRRITLNNDNDHFDESDRLSVFQKTFSTLEDKEQKAVELRWLSENPRTIQQIADELGSTRQYASFLCKRGIKKLSERLNSNLKKLDIIIN